VRSEVTDSLVPLLMDGICKPSRGPGKLRSLELVGRRWGRGAAPSAEDAASVALTAVGLTVIAHALASNSTLTSIAVRGYQASTDGLRAFATMLSQNHALRALDLRAHGPSEARPESEGEGTGRARARALDGWELEAEQRLLRMWVESGRSEQGLRLPFSEPS
jgi:hypothetical protein